KGEGLPKHRLPPNDELSTKAGELHVVALPELGQVGQVSPKQLAALVGVAPDNHDSGTKRGRRPIRGVRAAVRNVLSMVALVAVGYNLSLLVCYRHLLERGNPRRWPWSPAGGSCSPSSRRFCAIVGPGKCRPSLELDNEDNCCPPNPPSCDIARGCS